MGWIGGRDLLLLCFLRLRWRRDVFCLNSTLRLNSGGQHLWWCSCCFSKILLLSMITASILQIWKLCAACVRLKSRTYLPQNTSQAAIMFLIFWSCLVRGGNAEFTTIITPSLPARWPVHYKSPVYTRLEHLAVQCDTCCLESIFFEV